MKASDFKTETKIYILAACVMVLYWIFPIYTSWDTHTYQSAFTKLQEGTIDGFRPPVYPLYIGFFESLFGQHIGDYVVVIIQQALFVISAGYFYKLLTRILPGKKHLPFYATIFYIIYPGISSWPHSIMSEALAIIFTLFTVYWLVDIAINKINLKNVTLLTLFVTLAIFTRPASMYLLPLLLLFCAMLLLKKHYSESLRFAPAIIIPVILTLGYCSVMKRDYGIFSPSEIGTINEFWAFRQGHLLQPQDIADQRLKEELIASYEAESKDKYPYTVNQLTICDWSFDMYRKYGVTELSNVVNNVKKRAPVDVIKDIIIRLTRAAHEPINEIAVTLPLQAVPIISAFDIQFGLLYWIVIAYIILIVYYISKRKQIPLASMTFLFLTLGALAVIFIGAPCEFGRLFVQAIPIVIIMVSQMLSCFKISKNSGIRLA